MTNLLLYAFAMLLLWSLICLLLIWLPFDHLLTKSKTNHSLSLLFNICQITFYFHRLGCLLGSVWFMIYIKYGCHVNSVFTSVICLVFDLVHSKTPLFPKETLIDHFYVWSSFTSLWFCLFDTYIYEKRSCTQLLCVCACTCVCIISS